MCLGQARQQRQHQPQFTAAGGGMDHFAEGTAGPTATGQYGIQCGMAGGLGADGARHMATPQAALVKQLGKCGAHRLRAMSPARIRPTARPSITSS